MSIEFWEQYYTRFLWIGHVGWNQFNNKICAYRRYYIYFMIIIIEWTVAIIPCIEQLMNKTVKSRLSAVYHVTNIMNEIASNHRHLKRKSRILPNDCKPLYSHKTFFVVTFIAAKCEPCKVCNVTSHTDTHHMQLWSH